MTSANKPLIFISYSHEDEDWLNYLRSHLRTAEYGGEFEIWDDRRMLGGADWEAEIARALLACRVCIILVSRHSLTSDYINRVEMRRALERAAKENVFIYPIFISWTYLPEDHWLRKLNWRPPDGAPLQSLVESTGERDKAMVAIVAEIVKLTGSSRDREPDRGDTHFIDTSALPDVSFVKLRGREAELARLDAAWADPNVHVFSIVAWGGQGKTALVTVWVDRLKGEGGHGAEGILGWSFFSQGTKERATSSERFLDWALHELGLKDPGPSVSLKVGAIARELKRRRVLLILDGVESLQHGLGPQEGQLKDPTMRMLLRRVADGGSNGGLVLVTTRLEVKDIERWKDNAAPVLNLKALSEAAGAELLKDRGVRGSEKQLIEVVAEFKGHALALTLLSGFLVRRHKGLIGRRILVGPLITSGREMDEVHGQARRVMKSIDEEWLSQAPVPAAIMRVVGLFDRPAKADCLEALRQRPEIAGLEAWQKADRDSRADATHELRQVGLLTEADVETPDALDAHPLAREWFGDKLKQENEAAWKAAHSRLYDHLRRSTREGNTPDLPRLEPLFQAISHGCKAGRQRDTLAQIYVHRICRHFPSGILRFYAQHKLGAISQCLAALVWFFDRPFETPHLGLTREASYWVLAEVARLFGYLGQLEEALHASKRSLEIALSGGFMEDASRIASNLTEVELARGDITAAISSAAKAVELADMTKNEGYKSSFRTDYAATLTAYGDRPAAAILFAESERRVARYYPLMPRLSLLANVRFCDFLLDDQRFADVKKRSNYGLSISRVEEWTLIVGLDQVNLGRAELGTALRAASLSEAARCVTESQIQIDKGVDDLRNSNFAIYLPCGLLARARLLRAVGDFTRAKRELDEVLEIAEQGPMRLHLCDMRLELCRLALAERDGFAPLAEKPVALADDQEKLTKLAQAELKAAADLIELCGYHRRDTERHELIEVIAGKRPFHDLPVRV